MIKSRCSKILSKRLLLIVFGGVQSGYTCVFLLNSNSWLYSIVSNRERVSAWPTRCSRRIKTWICYFFLTWYFTVLQELNLKKSMNVNQRNVLNFLVNLRQVSIFCIVCEIVILCDYLNIVQQSIGKLPRQPTLFLCAKQHFSSWFIMKCITCM